MYIELQITANKKSTKLDNRSAVSRVRSAVNRFRSTVNRIGTRAAFTVSFGTQTFRQPGQNVSINEGIDVPGEHMHDPPVAKGGALGEGLAYSEGYGLVVVVQHVWAPAG